MTTAVPLLPETVKAANRRSLGCLEVTQKDKKIKLPLSAVKLSSRVCDRLAHVTVCQTFQNPFSDHLEAVYIFPLPGGSAVSSFQMKVGERLIDGYVDEREAARTGYAAAMQEGKRAALLEQDRDDVFTVQVGNLPPGEEITVILTYSEKLPYFDQGLTEIRLPLVVAPRYIPGAPLARESVGDGVELDTDQVPDASRISPPRLAPGVNANIDLSISVELDSSETIEDLSCSQHATRMSANKDGVTISLARVDDLLDRDFVLRWRVATDKVQSNFLIYRPAENDGISAADKKAGSAKKGAKVASDESDTVCYGMISLLPPREDEITKPARDVIFLVDRSGSMQGIKMASAARACSFLLATLGPSDRFAIQAFDDTADWLEASDGSYFFDADEAGLDAGMKFLRSIDSRGGTELHQALSKAIIAMNKRQSNSCRMPVIVLLTDGEVGNEASIFSYIQGQLGDNRVFTVGIDTAVNDGFLRRLASLGGGTATFVEPGAQLEAALNHVGREIGSPLITDLAIEGINCGLDKDSLAPSSLPDLFEGRAVNAFFRLLPATIKDLKKAKVKITGKYADGRDFVTEVCAKTTDVQALPQLWAKSFVVDLEDQYRIARGNKQDALKKEIVAVAIEHALLTKFTAFVVVDHSQVVNEDGTARKVVQAVQMPAKWEEQGQSPMAGTPGMVFAVAPAPQCAPSSGSCWGAAPTADSGWGAPPSQPASNQPAANFNNIASSSGGKHASLGGLSKAKSQGWSDDSQMDAGLPPGGAGESWHAFDQQASPPAGAQNPLRPGQQASPPAAPQNPPFPAPQASPPMLKPQAGGGQGNLNIIHPLNDDAIDKLFAQNLGVSAKNSAPLSQPNFAPSASVRLDPDWRVLQKCFKSFEKILKEVLQALGNGQLPEGDKLDLARCELLKALANSPLASQLPKLQKYLRADLLVLLSALASAKAVGQKLQDLAHEHEEKIDQAAEEVLNQAPEDSKPFWGLTV